MKPLASRFGSVIAISFLCQSAFELAILGISWNGKALLLFVTFSASHRSANPAELIPP